MKTTLFKTVFFLAITTSLSTNAQTVNKSAADKLSTARATQSAKGGVATGGGDLCEDRIKSIRDDLKTWINGGGSESLDLPSGVEQDQYIGEMLGAISTGKIRCVAKGDLGYPVLVKGTPKACRFDRRGSESLVTCDVNKFMRLSESDQYVLIHHEYAGIAKIEIPNGSDSDYSVSNQISDFLLEASVKKLAVRFNGSKFESVSNDELANLKKQIQWHKRAYHLKTESDSWFALKYVENVAYTQTPEDRVKDATSAKIRVDGNRTVLLFEKMVDYKLKTVVAVSIENDIIQAVRVEMLTVEFGSLKDDGTIPERWKVIGWESHN